MSLDRVKERIAPAADAAEPTLVQRIEGLRPHLERAVPAGTVDVDRFILEAWHAIRASKYLVMCDWSTLGGGILTAAQLGLSLNPTLGEAWLIPRKARRQDEHGKWRDVWEANFQLGYKGVLKLARRSGTVGAVTTGTIHDWGELEEVYGTSPRLVVRPIRPRPAEPIAYWCRVQMLDGADDVFAVMERSELEAIRDSIPGANRDGSAWREHFDAMASLTVFRRLRSMLPLSVDLATALEADGTAITERDALPQARASAMLPALDGHSGAARPLSIAEGGPTPDGEPFPVDDLPPDGADAAPHPPEQSNEGGPDGRAADEQGEGVTDGAQPSTSGGDLSAAVAPDPDIDEPPPFEACRTWASRHGLSDVVRSSKNATTACRRLASHLGIEQAAVWTLITNDSTPPPMPEEGQP